MRRFGARALAAVPLWLFLTAGWASAQAANRHPGTDVGALHPQTLGFDYDNRFLGICRSATASSPSSRPCNRRSSRIGSQTVACILADRRASADFKRRGARRAC